MVEKPQNMVLHYYHGMVQSNGNETAIATIVANIRSRLEPQDDEEEKLLKCFKKPKELNNKKEV